MDYPRVEPYKKGVFPDWTRGLSLPGAVKNKEVFWIGLVVRPHVEFLTQCYYPHTSIESVSPVCGIVEIYTNNRKVSDFFIITKVWGEGMGGGSGLS